VEVAHVAAEVDWTSAAAATAVLNRNFIFLSWRRAVCAAANWQVGVSFKVADWPTRQWRTEAR
jgi:hypothetical protein